MIKLPNELRDRHFNLMWDSQRSLTEAVVRDITDLITAIRNDYGGIGVVVNPDEVISLILERYGLKENEKSNQSPP